MSAAPAAGPSTHVLWLICVTDCLDHAVIDTEFEAGLVAGQGAYQAMCGHVVYTCSMLTPPGPPCSDCRDRHARHVSEQRAEWHRRNRWWRRLARRVRRGQAQDGRTAAVMRWRSAATSVTC